VREHGPLPVDSVLALAAGLAESLTAMHAAGVVHRGLKPSNVLLAEDGPRLIDFGIWQAAEATPGFMSPEQAEGGDVGPSSDVFSLGAVLVFAAKGQGPFGSGSTTALIYRVVHSPPDLHRVSAQVRPLVKRCLAKDPSQRPAAADFPALTGDVKPVTGWLPDSILRAFPRDPVPAAEQAVTAWQQPPPPQPAAPQPPPAPQARRRRLWRR
jgi:eukaryotic-like serine/threonine-protein kinase